ncbi:MAG: NAD-dependent epimerase/dehydratase family protein, partial [Candidatus Doudnabacteria bacterium]|nr:NAD-dependent epimerase/dehydratase family protein [Candidatus Doudnabacteria bacterium]
MLEQFTDKLRGKRILVTGGAGFLGSHLCGRLLAHGAKVICFDDLSTGTRENINEYLGRDEFAFVTGDANKFADLSNVFDAEKIDYVFHYAARVGVKRTTEQPLEVLEDVEGIKNVLHLSNKHNVEKVIFSSSSEVYGEPVEFPERENGHVNPKLPYASVKHIGEKFMESYHKVHGLRTCSLRFFNIYGPKQDSSAYGFVVGIFIKQALSGGPLTVLGDGTQTRDFVFVDDNINSSILALLTNATDGHVVNIGTGRPMTILDMAELVIKVTGKDVKIEFLPFREGEIRHRFPDVSKMRSLLGYRPMHTIEEGVRKTM